MMVRRLIAPLIAIFLMGLSPAGAQTFEDAMARGREARVRSDLPAAEAAFAQATALAPANPEAWHMLGLVRGFRGAYDAALTALERAEQLAPADQDIALSLARINGFAGRYGEANRRLDAILAKTPNAAPVWTLKGRIASYQNQLAAARSAYDRAASLAPPDVDLLVAYGDLARIEGDEPRALGYYQRAAALDPASADVKARLTKQATTKSNLWTLTVGGGKSWLSRTPAPDWTALDVALSRDLGNRARVFGGLSTAKRFSRTDTMLRAGASGDIAKDIAASFEVGITPNDDVLPELQIAGSLSAKLSEGHATLGPTVAVIEGQIRRYGTGTVKTVSPGFDQYVADGQFVLSARLANTWDPTGQHLMGWSASALWQATDRVALRLGTGNAPEAERGLVADTESLSGGLQIALSDALTWRLDVLRERRQGSYRRTEFTSGIAITF